MGSEMCIRDRLKDKNRKLIVTTIQKLDIAIGRESYLSEFADLADEKVAVSYTHLTLPTSDLV